MLIEQKHEMIIILSTLLQRGIFCIFDSSKIENTDYSNIITEF